MGEWRRMPDKGHLYEIMSCPSGFSRKGIEQVLPDKQECQRCHDTLEYILQPASHDCQICPPGLVCHGNHEVEPVVEGSAWIASDDLMLLQTCPYGYYMIPTAAEPFNAELQQCQPCRYFTTTQACHRNCLVLFACGCETHCKTTCQKG